MSREPGWEEFSPGSTRTSCLNKGLPLGVLVGWGSAGQTAPSSSHSPKKPCWMPSQPPPSSSSKSKDATTSDADPKKGRSHHHTSQTAGQAARLGGGRSKCDNDGFWWSDSQLLPDQLSPLPASPCYWNTFYVIPQITSCNRIFLVVTLSNARSTPKSDVSLKVTFQDGSFKVIL